jgi:hypothetical protein
MTVGLLWYSKANDLFHKSRTTDLIHNHLLYNSHSFIQFLQICFSKCPYLLIFLLSECAEI